MIHIAIWCYAIRLYWHIILSWLMISTGCLCTFPIPLACLPQNVVYMNLSCQLWTVEQDPATHQIPYLLSVRSGVDP